MGASSETLTFDANASKVLAELAKIQAEYKTLNAEMKKTATTAVKGSVDASKSLEDQANKLINLKKRADEARNALGSIKVPKGGLAELAAMERNAETFTRSTGRASQAITQLSFGVDDFITVAQNQEGWKGIIAGARGASNNISMVLAQINPLYAIIPSVATALATLGLKFFDTGEGAKEAEPKMSTYAETMKKLREETEGALEGQKGLKTALEDTEASNRYMQERSKVVAERDAAKAEIDNEGFWGGLVASVPGLGGWEEERRQAAANKAMNAEGKLRDLDFKENARQKAVADKRQRDAATEADKATTKTATAKLTPLKGALGKLAEASVKEGDAPDVTLSKLTNAAGAVLTPDEARVAKSQIAEIAGGARGNVLGASIETAIDPNADAKVAMKQTDAAIASVKRERNEAERQSPRGKLSKVQEREFQERLNPLEQTKENLQAAMEAGTKETQTSNSLLKDILAAIKDPKPTKPAPRPIDRNAGQ